MLFLSQTNAIVHHKVIEQDRQWNRGQMPQGMSIECIEQGWKVIDLKNQRESCEYLKDKHFPRIDPLLPADHIPHQPTKPSNYPSDNIYLHIVLVIKLIPTQVIKVVQEE